MRFAALSESRFFGWLSVIANVEKAGRSALRASKVRRPRFSVTCIATISNGAGGRRGRLLAFAFFTLFAMTARPLRLQRQMLGRLTALENRKNGPASVARAAGQRARAP